MASRLTVLLSAAALGAALSAMPASAQRRGGGRGYGRRGPGTISFGSGQTGPSGVRGPQGRSGRGRRGGRRFDRGRGGAVYPYWYPYGGYDEGVAPPEKSQPPAPVVVVNRPAAPAPAPPSPPPESLLLEYRDGQWVRVPTGEKVPAGPLAAQPQQAPQWAPQWAPQRAEAPASKTGAASANRPAQTPPKLRNVILVFRNGRREEIRKYVIHGSVLYASQPYWKTGSWTRKIPIAELNVPATLRLNRERGVKFDLPSGPSEVVVGF